MDQYSAVTTAGKTQQQPNSHEYLAKLLFWYGCAVMAVLGYVIGYFPMDITEKFDALDPPKQLYGQRLDYEAVERKKFDRAILLVIDGFRFDLANRSEMEYFSSELEKNGCLFNAMAQIPTVTMPRIRALTTGTVPGYANVLFNLGTGEVTDDSILHQASLRGRKMVFYGDDTWLKLYPHFFMRKDGTTSFFVSDYTEVDLNVTRHVMAEMYKSDWDLMFLHYLGLDHIGHLEGPFGTLMGPKLSEMDDVIRYLHQKSGFVNRSTIIFVTGDHGMRDSGSHGGSGNSETSVVFGVLGMPCSSRFNETVQQVDIPTTLSALLNLPYPSQGVGMVMPNVIGSLPLNVRLYHYYHNFLVYSRRMDEEQRRAFDEAQELHSAYLQKSDLRTGEKAEKLYVSNLVSFRELLITKVANQNIILMVYSCLAVFVALLKILDVSSKSTDFGSVLSALAAVAMPMVVFYSTFTPLGVLMVAAMVLIFIKTLYDLTMVVETFKVDSSPLVLLPCLGIGVLASSFLSTSFIEEEHQTWYFFWGLCSMVGLHTANRWVHKVKWACLLLGLRLVRGLNQVGDKWSSHPDVADWLMASAPMLFLVHLAGLVTIFFILRKLAPKDVFISLSSAAILILIFFYRLGSHNSVQVEYMAKLTIVCILATTGRCLYLRRSIDSVIFGWILYMTLLVRPYNVIVLISCYFGCHALADTTTSSKSPMAKALLHYWFGFVMFFCQGLCNTFASLDIATGYVALTDYNVGIVSLQLLCHSYAMPVLAFLMLMACLESLEERIQAVFVVASCRLTTTAVVCLVCFILKSHLFVWSVLAPKLLIESIHLVVFLLMSSSVMMAERFKICFR